MEIEIMFKRNPHPLRFFQPPEKLHFISNTCRTYFPPFIFLGKTEEVFGMHEWAAKQKEKKNEKPRKLKWKIFTRMRG